MRQLKKYTILILTLSICCACTPTVSAQGQDNLNKDAETGTMNDGQVNSDISKKILGQKELNTQTINPSASLRPTISDLNYKLKAGDELRIYVFGVEDLTGEFKISANNYITMPLIGEIGTHGLNKLELQDKITSALIDGDYFNAPKVTVEVITQTPFYILGEVKNPGSYEYEPGLDLFKAIAIAGGYTPRAVKNKAIIIRKINGEKVKINADELTEIEPGDSIKIRQRFF